MEEKPSSRSPSKTKVKDEWKIDAEERWRSVGDAELL
jgi:hypothetical protein